MTDVWVEYGRPPRPAMIGLLYPLEPMMRLFEGSGGAHALALVEHTLGTQHVLYDACRRLRAALGA